MNNLPKHHDAGPQRRGAQCSCIGCIGLWPALVARLGYTCGNDSNVKALIEILRLIYNGKFSKIVTSWTEKIIYI